MTAAFYYTIMTKDSKALKMEIFDTFEFLG